MGEFIEHVPDEGEMMQQEIEVVRIAPEGTGFGHGSISGHIEGLTAEVYGRVDKAIESPQILVPVDKDDDGKVITDDGCGDGRRVKLIEKANEKFKRSLNRAKVFGGGVVMGMATLIGQGKTRGRSLEELADDSIDLLDEHYVDYGAHNAEQVAHGSDCGCGAIDKAPDIVHSVVVYEEPIRKTLGVLLELDKAPDDMRQLVEQDIDMVMANYKSYAASIDGQDYEGKNVFDKIVKRGKITKQLEGGHSEIRILLNKVTGYTVNQELVREVSGDQAQVFAVDVWRLEDIARKAYPDDEDMQRRAVVSQLVHTLAISAVLTDGSLPVDVIAPKYALAA